MVFVARVSKFLRFLARCLTRFLARLLTQIVDQIFGQVFGRGFDQGVDQVLGEGNYHENSIQNYRDGTLQCTVLLRRKHLLHRLVSETKFKLFQAPLVGF